MSKSRHREVACAIIIDTEGRFLLQQRDDIPDILQPGKISLFGGQREGDETSLQCVVREIHEEISYFIAPDRFEHLATHEDSDFESDGGTVTVRGEIFVARDVPADKVKVTEGALLIAKPDELTPMKHKFAPQLEFAMKAYLDSKRRMEVS
jgi:8-oxo-dGTP diphosphatase